MLGAIVIIFGAIYLSGCSTPAPLGTSSSAKSGGSGGGLGVIVLGDASLITQGGAGTSANQSPTLDANCGISISDMSQEPADLLLVLDRSTSMSWDMARDNLECAPSSTTCQQRWFTVTRTLEEVLKSSSGKIHWGLKLFATPMAGGSKVDATENCYVSPGVDVAVGPGTSTNIKNTIQGTGPLGYTPTLLSLKHGIEYLKNLSDPYQRYILLATDGEPNCDGASDTVSGAVQVNHVISEINAATEAGIKVFVIGVGPTSGVRNLDKFAVAGGTQHYYPATSATELVQALASIVGQVASCTYTLSSIPPDPNNLGVYLDKQIVSRNVSDGWTLSPNQRSVVFSGSYCEGIRAEHYHQVQVYFGCPNGELPITIP